MTWVIIVVAVLVVIAAVAMAFGRSAALKRRFGPEYYRMIDETGGRRAAEASLRDRAKRRDSLEIHELSPEAQSSYRGRWRDVQAGFVDDPRRAVAHADWLVQEVMRERGYPADEFDDRVDMVSVDHPALAENYRIAHAIHVRSGTEGASIDDLREAFQRYREVFGDLLTDGVDENDADAGDHRDTSVERDVPREHDVR